MTRTNGIHPFAIEDPDAAPGARIGLPVVVIGAGPVGLAAAAHLLDRGLEPLVLEAGPQVGANIAQWPLARAALVADLYGVAAYASINGVLALPLTLARAAAPVAAAALHTATGNYRLAMVAVTLCSLVASLAMARSHQLGRY